DQPHGDSRRMAFDANKDILLANDGGIYRFVNPADPAKRSWQSVNGNIHPTEFNSVAYDSLNHTLFGGVQDNGNPQQSGKSSLTWGDKTGSDGNVVAVDTHATSSVPDSFSYHYVATQNLAEFYRLKVDATNKEVERHAVGLIVSDTGGTKLTVRDLKGEKLIFDDTVGFLQPYVLNAVDPSRMLIGTGYLSES